MNAKKAPDQGSNQIKDPDDWVTGDEEMTGAQASYLQTLAEQAHEAVDPDLTKAEASKKIDELQQKTGRGRRPRQAAGTPRKPAASRSRRPK
ncbi:MAG: DUF3072 domain-containing protein [Alphaproteobacteria bacterium]|nr:DUF3072 domain-containing protein [Alphaproteobacteria bacterium]